MENCGYGKYLTKKNTMNYTYKGITNIGFSALATFGGPIGLTIGLVYWGLDLLGAFYSPTLAPNIRKDPYIQPVDNLRVVLPIHSFPPSIIKRRFSP